MKIALVYNARPVGLDRTDPRLEAGIEGDEWKTIKAIGDTLIALGHKLSYYLIDDSIYERLKSDKDNLDLLFNLSEGVSGGSDREAHIPMFAEILGIPYTGPGPLSAALILNKTRAKEIWKAHGVPTAKSQLFTTTNDILSSFLHYPLIVKPNGEGSGMGIKSNSIVKNKAELKVALKTLLSTYRGGALVEEYLDGREFTIALVGNGDSLITLPIIEINFDVFPTGTPRVDTYEAKFVYGATGLSPMEETEFCPAKVTPELETELNQAAMAAFRTIGCRDFGRVDLRLGTDGKVYVLEINHPPGLMSDPSEMSFFNIAAREHGWDLKHLLKAILSSATTRLQL
jgi:D-alanine-D-alanine ligase